MHISKSLNQLIFISCLLLLYGCGGDQNTGLGPSPMASNNSTSDTTPPKLSFSPSTVMVISGQTHEIFLKASDNIGIRSGPTVTCTKNGVFEKNRFKAPIVEERTKIDCLATTEDAAGNQGQASLSVTVNPQDKNPEKVIIEGVLTYDMVPINKNSLSLDFSNTVSAKVPNVTIEAIDRQGKVLATSSTNQDGFYSLSLAANRDVKLRAKAEMIDSNDQAWNLSVVDNTQSNTRYVLEDDYINTGSHDNVRNLHASSGWNGREYSNKRVAAPFAILVTIHHAMQKLRAVDPALSFPPLEIGWSPKNRPQDGPVSEGFIGRSSYIGDGRILLLGDENINTDEYDRHVILHEWTHYLEDILSRSDTLGGAHTQIDHLDPRVAFAEGFANAFSGILLDDPLYIDTGVVGQKAGISINLEKNDVDLKGWYSEASVQSVIYDIFDSQADNVDNIEMGLEPYI